MTTPLQTQLEHLLNCHCAENGSDTPDFILAQYLMDCLAAFDKTLEAREKWYGRTLHRNAEPTVLDGPPQSPFQV